MWKIREDILNQYINSISDKTFLDLQNRINLLEEENKKLKDNYIMVKVIETNLSMNNFDKIMDHQSRIIEVESWQSYIDEIANQKMILRQPVFGNMNGSIIPQSKSNSIKNLETDEFHLSFESFNSRNMKTKTLAYLIR